MLTSHWFRSFTFGGDHIVRRHNNSPLFIAHCNARDAGHHSRFTIASRDIKRKHDTGTEDYVEDQDNLSKHEYDQDMEENNSELSTRKAEALCTILASHDSSMNCQQICGQLQNSK